MKRFRKIYIEISNVCNLNCHFCPGTKRTPRIMSIDEFSYIAQKIREYTDFLYFHIMGEPLCHPQLPEFLSIAEKFKFKVIITTNGTLLHELSNILLSSAALHKINISLHAFEANDLPIPFDKYLVDCFDFGKRAEGKKIVVYRLWNNGGEDNLNSDILSRLKSYFEDEWVNEKRGIRIADKVYVERGDKFDWPDLSITKEQENSFCYGLRDQIGVLCDGSVVPCCLDHEGDITLGNIFENTMEEILNSDRAISIHKGFCEGKAVEELCRKCGYATRFSK